MFFGSNIQGVGSQNLVEDEQMIIRNVIKDDYWSSLFVKPYLVTIPLYAVAPDAASNLMGIFAESHNGEKKPAIERDNVCSIPIDSIVENVSDGVDVTIHKQDDIIKIYNLLIRTIDIESGYIPWEGFIMPADRIERYKDTALWMMGKYKGILSRSRRKKPLMSKCGLLKPNQVKEKKTTRAVPRYDFVTGVRI